MTEGTTEDIGKKLVNLEDLKSVYSKDKLLQIFYGSIMNFEYSIPYEYWEALYSDTNPFQYRGFIFGSEVTPESLAATEFVQFCSALKAAGYMNGIIKIVDDDENVLFRAVLRSAEEAPPYKWMILAIID